jgi:hypothetical protein
MIGRAKGGFLTYMDFEKTYSDYSFKVVASLKVVALFRSVKAVPMYFSSRRQSSMPPKTPAIPREVLEPMMRATLLTAQDIRVSMRGDQWNSLQSRNAQVAFLAEFAERECSIQLLNLSLAEAFGLTASHIHTIRAKARKKQKKQKSPHRPLSVTDDQEKAIREMVRERAIAGIYVTQREILNFVETKFRKTLTCGWSECFLKQHSEDIRKTVHAP